MAGEQAIDLHDGAEELVDEAYEIYFDAMREVDESLWQTIKAEALGNDLAVTGATKVLGALRQKRVEVLMIEEDREIPGTRCRDCEHVVHGTPDTCQSCGSSDVLHFELTEELVRLAETSSASTQFPEPIPGLSDAGGVAALLRW